MKKIVGAGIAISMIVGAAAVFATGEVLTISQPTEAQKAIVTCMKQATLTREGNLMAAASNFSSATLVAYNIRSSAISNAYDAKKTLKEIKPALKEAFDTWKTTVKTARTTMKKARKDTWTVYKNDVKNCRIESSDARSELKDIKTLERIEESGM